MAKLTFVDTDILIDAGRGINEAVSYLQRLEHHSQPAISVVTQMELIVGCRNKTELRELERFLKRFYIIGIAETISDTALALLLQYRLSHGLLIAATAIDLDAPLASKNQRDYRFIANLDLLPYPP